MNDKLSKIWNDAICGMWGMGYGIFLDKISTWLIFLNSKVTSEYSD